MFSTEKLKDPLETPVPNICIHMLLCNLSNNKCLWRTTALQSTMSCCCEKASYWVV